MMQATDFWNGDDSSDVAMLNRPRVGAILVERKMRAGALVIVDIRGQDAAQMALDVIETLAANRNNHALDVRVLPRRACRRDDFRDPSLRLGCGSTSHTIRRDRAAGSAERCPTETLRLPDAITKPQWDV